MPSNDRRNSVTVAISIFAFIESLRFYPVLMDDIGKNKGLNKSEK